MMADMITLILTGLLRGARTQRSLALENRYYHGARTHLSLAKDAPEPRPVERIVETPMAGGLHHRYGRRAA
jgi:hypothetical protein